MTDSETLITNLVIDRLWKAQPIVDPLSINILKYNLIGPNLSCDWQQPIRSAFFILGSITTFLRTRL